MGVSSCVRPFPSPQIPNFKTAAAADERDLAFQADSLAKFFRQNQTALSVGGAMLGAGMQLAKENAPIASRNIWIRFGGRAHTRKFLRRHDQEKLIIRFRKNDELLGAIAAPAGGDGDAIFFVEE